MRVLPAGEFMMGSPEDEKGHRGNESPQRKVSIARKVAVMESEVTREQFSIFANEIKYQASSNCNWRTPGFLQTDQHPVVCISWSDAVSYARWLSSKTKKNYRLLSEMEWEFSARAGNNARWSFGESDGDICTHANIRDSGNWSTNESGDPKQAALDSLAAPATCNDQAKFTAAARSYKPNNWGLYDLHGNVWEWVNDCWRDNNTGPPSAENSQELACLDRSRTLRGGSWSFSADFSRSAARIRYVEGNRDNSTGFRLARDIDQ
ncbi:MAG TPA: SUMF1/EgtB/PvdO family nonheme iron enzyme [Burkholderiaceae bacterium]|nr:SUMF1/EgtB/PvdO family nonheme iron enzyme [Burkholderiaceae bacterium]HMZ01195.1 SUMF1/EgtB/PvdO family nonheme iron enzyme [Burkholderiaceae bacterium]HNG81069.1 SUMF1/EgtB/PvdO family nonheme iron enzyme [Burkholderiaceae bacterium]